MLKDAGESEALEILKEKLRMEFVRQGLDQALECGRVFCVERSVTAFEAGFATIPPRTPRAAPLQKSALFENHRGTGLHFLATYSSCCCLVLTLPQAYALGPDCQ